MLDTEKTSPFKLIALLMKLGQRPMLIRMSLLRWIALLMFCCTAGISVLLLNKIKKVERKQKQVSTFIQQLKSGSSAAGSYFGKTPIPFKLATVPYGEDSGLVASVKNVQIRGIKAPYNATLIPAACGYDLFFRYDILSHKAKHVPFLSHIGVVHLNAAFEQEDLEFKPVAALSSGSPEDPRAILVNDQLYLIYNALRGDRDGRSIQLAHLDRDTFRVNYTTALDVNLQLIEKNWAPFEYRGDDKKASLFLEYQIIPHKVFQLPDPKINALQSSFLDDPTTLVQIPWEHNWGRMRGGTPAQLIDGEYLAFFHSAFEDKSGIIWYVMGAYTFENQPPFRLTSVSNYPILYRGIYETPHGMTASMNKRVCFPCGFAVEKKDDQEWIHVALGENDSGVKIVTLNKQKLFDSLLKVALTDAL